MEYFFRSVSGLGNVAVSRHAQARITADGIHPDAYTRALLEPTRPDVCEGADVLWRERDGLRIVVLTNPTANLGAVLVKTVYRVEKQASARRS